jgi:NTE family protein
MPSQPKIGLALGSGGWRGLAHLGVIKSLLHHGFKISAISGSSSGALIGGLFAYFQNVPKIETFFSQLNYKDLLFAFSDPSTKLGLFGGKNTTKLFQKYLGNVHIENLPIPFAAIAADILSGQPLVIRTGSLASAIRASSSVPLVFEPIKRENALLIDGGTINPVPVSTTKILGADIVIGVDVYHSMFQSLLSTQKLSKVDVINLSYHLILSQLAAHDASKADIIIRPNIKNLALDPFSQFINNQQTILEGEQAMDQAIDQLNHLLLTWTNANSPRRADSRPSRQTP